MKTVRDFSYPRFFAHRCGGCLAPENTLAGLRLAARLGYRGVEFDVMLCRDGAPVLIHDETLERTTNGAGSVARTSLLELRRLDAGGRMHRAYANEPIPTLEEALACCGELGLTANIEIKPAAGMDRETGIAVARAVASGVASGVAKNAASAVPVLLSSFSEAALAWARECSPASPRALLFDAVPPDWRERLQGLDCLALHCSASHLTAALASELATAGVPFACYTVNSLKDAARLFGLGAAALFTDRLDLFDPGESHVA